MEIVLAIVFSFITVISCKNNEYHLPNSLIAAKAIITGEASYYEDQYQQRITLLNDDTIEDVVFSPYDVPSSLNLFLYVGDISTDPNNLSNRLLADIYEKNSIKIVY